MGREAGAARPGGGVVVPGLLDLLLVCTIRAWMDEGAVSTTGRPGRYRTQSGAAAPVPG